MLLPPDVFAKMHERGEICGFCGAFFEEPNPGGFCSGWCASEAMRLKEIQKRTWERLLKHYGTEEEMWKSLVNWWLSDRQCDERAPTKVFLQLCDSCRDAVLAFGPETQWHCVKCGNWVSAKRTYAAEDDGRGHTGCWGRCDQSRERQQWVVDGFTQLPPLCAECGGKVAQAIRLLLTGGHVAWTSQLEKKG